MRMLDLEITKRNIKKIIYILESSNINVIYNPLNDIIVGIENQKDNDSKNIIVIKSIIESKIALIQPILSKGDRRVSKIIHSAYLKGDSIEAWREAIQNFEIPNSLFIEEKPITYKYPWEFIEHGIDRTYLKNEWNRARKGLKSPMCFNGCTRCKICNNKIKVEEKCQKSLIAS